MYFLEQGNVDDDATLITIVLVSFNLQSCCLMKSANGIHRISLGAFIEMCNRLYTQLFKHFFQKEEHGLEIKL